MPATIECPPTVAVDPNPSKSTAFAIRMTMVRVRDIHTGDLVSTPGGWLEVDSSGPGTPGVWQLSLGRPGPGLCNWPENAEIQVRRGNARRKRWWA